MCESTSGEGSLRLVLRILLIFPVIAILAVWVCMALWIDGPESRLVAGFLCTGFILASGAIFYKLRPFPKGLVGFLVLFAAVAATVQRGGAHWQSTKLESALATR